jgi:hypothetical protein
MNDSDAGRGVATDIYTANVTSKRDLVSQTEKKVNNNSELAAKDKSAKSQKDPSSKPVDANEIQFQMQDEEEDSDDPQQLQMMDANSQGEVYEEESEEEEEEDAPVPATNINKSKPQPANASGYNTTPA